MKQIGFIGAGIMGKSMIRNLMKAGFTLRVYARTRAKIEDILSEGAVYCDSISGCVRGVDAVITIVGYPKDVEEVYLGAGSIMDSAASGTYLIDMTTSSPTLAEKLHAEGKSRGLRVMDAPVTGGDVGARNGALSILAGGDAEDYEACLPLFRAMGTNINHQGCAGCGQHAKMANQIIIAGTLSGICESLAYASRKGLDRHKLLGSLSSGAAGSRQLDLLGPKIVDGDYAPGFFLKHFIKDMGLALEEARNSGLEPEVLRQVLESCSALEAEGLGDSGTQVLIEHYNKM